MNKPNLSGVVKNVQKTLVKHSPEILTGIGIAGMISTTIMAVKVTPKALRLIRDAEYEKEGALTTSEKAKAVWKVYTPAAVTGAVSIACLIGASSVNAKRNAALATAYTLTETTLKEYKEKVVETIGEKKERSIRDQIAKDRIERNPIHTNEIIITNKGDTLCYDAIGGRYFKSDIEKIRKCVNDLNERLLSEMYISLNEFYYGIGLECTGLGDELGWNLDNGLIDVHFSSQLTKDGEPCLVIDYHIAPRYRFDKLM